MAVASRQPDKRDIDIRILHVTLKIESNRSSFKTIGDKNSCSKIRLNHRFADVWNHQLYLIWSQSASTYDTIRDIKKWPSFKWLNLGFSPKAPSVVGCFRKSTWTKLWLPQTAGSWVDPGYDQSQNSRMGSLHFSPQPGEIVIKPFMVFLQNKITK